VTSRGILLMCRMLGIIVFEVLCLFGRGFAIPCHSTYLVVHASVNQAAASASLKRTVH
jgi:hypothetical protein